MNKKLLLFREIGFIVLSFLLPFIILIIVFSVNKIALTSYDNYTIIMIDMQSEYIAYLRNLKQILLYGDSLIYTNAKVFGGDYLSIFTFYLSSPFNLFAVLFQDKALPLFFVWSSIIKMSFASMNFYLLGRFTGKFNYHRIMFALGYGLISYSLIYLSNYMWLDGVMILPLVILGLHFLKDGKQYWLYPLAIGYSLMTSWYIGFMVCVFATLYFLYLFIANFKKEDLYFLKFLIRFVVFSLIGGFIAAPYWLTAFIHLSGTKGFSEVPKMKWFSISQFIGGLLENNYTNVKLITQYNSYISMFTGIVSVVFFITFFFNKEFKLRDRLALLGVFLFYFIFSTNTVTAALLHGGKEPTWFPGRYSFVIGFLVCYTASRSADESHKLHPAFYSAPLLLGIVGILILKFVKHSSVTEYYPLSVVSIILYFTIVVIAFVISLLQVLPLNEKFKKVLPYLPAVFIIAQVVSVYRGTDMVIRTNRSGNNPVLQKYETYLKDDEYQQYFDKIKKYEKENDNSPFYRMEATFNRPGNYNRINNNPMFYSYNGLSNYSSSSKKDVEGYLYKLGFHYNYFFGKYENGSTYSINSLLGIKYLLEDTTASQKYKTGFLDYNTFNKLDLEGREGINYYLNPNVVSLGFLSDKTTSYFINEGTKSGSGNTYWFDHFEYQNQLFRTLDNSIDEDIFKPLPITTVITDIEYTSDEFGTKTFKNAKAGEQITFKFNAPSEALVNPVYFGEKNYQQKLSYYVNGSYIGTYTFQDKGTLPLKGLVDGENSLRIYLKEDVEEITIRPELYYEDLTVSKKYLDSLNTNGFVLDKVVNSSFKKAYKGHINIINNEKDLIFTIPYESGISVFVDGKKVKTMQKLNVFTAISLRNLKEGNHKITIQYQDNGLVASIPIFMISIFALPPLFIFYDKFEILLFKKRKRKEI